ncbi:MAG: exodeoxyribonuclease VII large subunit [Deltaproteobacteria bacterium]|nr:exodeoxyribonuclease VII large subunit [Deltaproteobacteria bacterium]
MPIEQKVYTPSELTDLIHSTFARHVGTVTVAGEVSSMTIANSGHAYLEIRDKKAMIKGTVWKSSRVSSGFSAIQKGLMVQARGKLTNYGPRSEYQISIDRIVPMGEGSLSLAYEKLKKKLDGEGLFAPGRKRPFPRPPRRVALLASAGSAAANDFIETSVKRCRGAWISLFSVRVQGKGAAEEMAGALELLNSWGGFDLAVMTRGGGSLEDLWAYNEEILVRAVANSRLPVLAAVGHSTDLSLVEMAADAQAITPTAAAEAVYPLDSDRLAQVGDILSTLSNLARDVFRARRDRLQSDMARLGQLRYKLNYFSQLIDTYLINLENAVRKLITSSRNELSAAVASLEHKSPRRDQAQKRQNLALLVARLESAAAKALEAKRLNLSWLANSLNLVSPLNTLTRGYSVVTGPDGKVISAADQAEVGQELTVILALGKLRARVTEKIDAEKTAPDKAGPAGPGTAGG